MAEGSNWWDDLWKTGSKAARNAAVGAVAITGVATTETGAQTPPPASFGIERIDANTSADERMVICGGRNVELRTGDIRWAHPGADPFAARGEVFAGPERINIAFQKFRDANVLNEAEEAALRASLEATVNQGDPVGGNAVILPGCRIDAMVFGGGVAIRGNRTDVRVWPNVVFAPDEHTMPAGTVQHFAEAQVWHATVGGQRLTLLLSEACNNLAVIKGPAPVAEAAATPPRVEGPNCAEAQFRMNGTFEAREGHRLDLRYYIVGQEGTQLPPSVCAAFKDAADNLERLPTLDCHPNCPPELVINQIERQLRSEGILARNVELGILAQHVITNIDDQVGADGMLTIYEDLAIAQRAILVMCVVEVDEDTGRVTRTMRIKYTVPAEDFPEGDNVAEFGTPSQPWLMSR